MQTVVIDITQFLSSPFRTGIQRVTHEIISKWPRDILLIPAKVTPQGRFQILSPRIFFEMYKFFEAGEAKSRERLLNHERFVYRQLADDDFDQFSAILNPELFFDEDRVAFYKWLTVHRPNKVFAVFYDWLPWLHPEWFPFNATFDTMPYLDFVRCVKNTAFISKRTRDEYLTTIVRDPSRHCGPVLSLGSDGLGTRPPSFSRDRRHFLYVGTIETRKNHAAVISSFEDLWNSGHDVELTFVGRMQYATGELHRKIGHLLNHEKRFRWVENLDDHELRDLITASRATLFPSIGEGFGLPPLESLALGVPVIVSSHIPSIQMIEPLGQVRLERTDKASVSHAIHQMLDDGFSMEKRKEIQALALPTWKDLGQSLATWITQTARSH